MRGATLTRLLNELRATCRLSLNPAQNAQVRDTHVIHLQRTQDWLWEDYNWPHLRVYRDIPIVAGERYYDPPEDIQIQRIEDLEIRYGNEWCRLVPGIGAPEYSTWDSDLDVRSWPVARWRITEDEQIELWPIPESSRDTVSLDGTLRVSGIRNLRPLVDDDDRCDLDHRLIVLFTAAEILAAEGAKDAKLKLDQAARLYASLKSDFTPRRRFNLLGGSDCDGKHLRGPPRVHYRVV